MIGCRVWHVEEDGDPPESGVVVGRLDNGDLLVRVDVDPVGWDWSVIGRPSSITTVWPRWAVSKEPPDCCQGISLATKPA